MNNKGKTFEGKIVAVPTAKTVIVAVGSVFRHRLYKKAIRRTRRFAADSGSLELAVGDAVVIRESKPISRTKHFIAQEKLS